MQRGLVGILAMMTAACSSPPVTGTVAGGLTGNPVKGLRLLARAGEGASMTCQADEAQTDENGTFTFSRMCPGVTYKLSDADKQLMFQGADGVSIEGNRVDLTYRPVITDPLTTEAEGGISLKKIAPRERTF